MSEITLGKTKITKYGKNFYIIAEIGTNYYELAAMKRISLLEAAKLMIKEAANNGAHAAKFQIYTAEKLISKTAREYKSKDIYNKLSNEDYCELMNYCKESNIDFSASLFDLDTLTIFGPKLDYFKVSSPDIIYEYLIKEIALYKKPILLSTGAATFSEILQATGWITSKSNFDICVMHCIAAYPTNPHATNLGIIRKLQRDLPYVIGYSDHCIFDIDVLRYAYILGANVIEKHLTYSNELHGGDHEHSMIPSQLYLLRKELESTSKVLGELDRDYLPVEQEIRVYGRRSAAAKIDIKIGEIITEDKIIFLRPGTEITSAKEIIGKRAIQNIKRGYLIKRCAIVKCD